MRVKPDGSASPSGSHRPDQERPRPVVLLDARAGPVAGWPHDRADRRTGPNPLQSDIVAPALRHRRRRSSRNLKLARVRRSATRIRPGAPDGTYLALRQERPRRHAAARRRSSATTQRRRSRRVTGPGYLAPAWSPDGRYRRRDEDRRFGTDVVILDATTGKELLRRHRTTTTRSRRSGRRPATRSRSSASTATIVDLEMAKLDGARRAAGRWATTIDLTKVSGLDGASRPSWFVPASELPAPTPPRPSAVRRRVDRRRRRPRDRRPAHVDRPTRPRAALVPRAARAPAPPPTGTVLCLGIDPDPAACPPAFSRDLRGVEAFARLLLEAAAPFAAAVKPNLAFFEAFGSAGLAALERLRARSRPDVPVVIDAKRGDIGSTAGAPGGRALTTASAPTRSRSARTSARRRSRRSSTAPIASPTSCAGRRTRAPPSSRACASPPDGERGAPAEPL